MQLMVNTGCVLLKIHQEEMCSQAVEEMLLRLEEESEEEDEEHGFVLFLLAANM